MAAAAVPLAIAAVQIGFSAYQGSQQAAAQQASYQAQTAQALAQATAEQQYQEELVGENERLMQENEARAIRHFQFQNLTEDQRLQQIRENLTNQSVDLRAEGLRARGQAAAERATAGAAGQSVDLVLADIRAQEGRQRAMLDYQFELEGQGANQRRRGFALELEQNRTAVQPYVPPPIHVQTPIQPPIGAVGGGLLGGIGGALNAATSIGLPTLRSYQATQPATPRLSAS